MVVYVWINPYLQSRQGRTLTQTGLDVLHQRWSEETDLSVISDNDPCKWNHCNQTFTHPVIFCGRLFWNSSSSTVQTAPFTFSTRTKHLWRLRLWRTAFWDYRINEQTDPGHRKSIKTVSFQLPSMLLHCVWNTQTFEWTSCRFHLVLAAFLETPKWPIN